MSTPELVTRGEILGVGSYGKVFKAVTGDRAIKDTDLADHAAFTSLVREWCVMSTMRHANIVTLIGLQCGGTAGSIVMELMQGTLSELIVGADEPLSDATRRSMCFQLLDALSFLHSRNIAHRDIKPANILYIKKEDGYTFKIADFGLSRPMGGTEFFTGNRISCPYRPPELLLAMGAYFGYDTKVDVWSLGIVILETIVRRRLFRGSDDQVLYSVGMMFPLGASSKAKLYQAAHGKKLHEKTDNIEVHLKRFDVVADDNLLRLLKRMLDVEPASRISSVDAMAHPYFDGLCAPRRESHQRTPAVACPPSNERTRVTEWLEGVRVKHGCSETTVAKSVETLDRLLGGAWGADDLDDIAASALVIASSVYDRFPITPAHLGKGLDNVAALTKRTVEIMSSTVDFDYLLEP